MTTLTSYGTIPTHRQGELIRNTLADSDANLLTDPNVIALIAAIRKCSN